MDIKKAKKLKRACWIFLIIYSFSFFIINWNDVSWLFNYKEVNGLISDFFNPYPSVDASSMKSYFYPNHSSQNFSAPQIRVKTAYTEKTSALEIPKIGITAPIVFSVSAEKSEIQKALDNGVVYYPGSVYPGQAGQIVILGHSAPPGWPKIKYEWVFSDLENLASGDVIFIDLNNQQYTYLVKQKTIIQRGREIPAENSTGNNNTLLLISCWPPGKDYQRIIVIAELKNP